jgi:exosortase A-associated hydrolase 1
MSAAVVSAETVESLLRFDGMLGVLAVPGGAHARPEVGVVIVVGGPQTRVGSHRQFVTMARALARAGYPCLRFDCAGMGDSTGPMPDFERAGSDIGRACAALQRERPECRRILLWGLCDGATAALFHSIADERIAAVCAANPWARSETTRSAAIVNRHYASRLRSPDFWTKLAAGKVNVLGSAREAVTHVIRAAGARRSPRPGEAEATLAARLVQALLSARCPVRLQLSGNDLTAAEFEVALAAVRFEELPHVTILRLEHADHTCSDPSDWRTVVEDTLKQLAALRG